MPKVLIVDDDKDIAELMQLILEKEQMEVTVKNSPLDILKDENINQYNLILLDIMMPELSGTELCSKIRDKVNSPIIFVSAKNELLDKMIGFEIGGDDYITKPFDKTELVLKVKSHLRMNKRILRKSIDNDDNLMVFGDLILNSKTSLVKKNNKKIELTTREFELLKYFMSNKNIALSKEQIFESVWGSEYGDIGTVAVNIKNLRDKIEDEHTKYIITIWGYGYKFVNGEDYEN